MKNNFKKLILILIIFSLLMPMLNGCLIKTNKERDLNQVVASVSVEGLTENVLKKELILAFNSYGYIYSYYGYDLEEIMDYLLYQLEANIAKVEYAKLAFTQKIMDRDRSFFEDAINSETITSFDKCLKKGNYLGKSFDTLTITSPSDEFLTEYEYLKAKYEILNNIDTLIDSVYNTETTTQTTTSYTERATLPQVELGNEEELKNDPEISVVSDYYLNEVNKINIDKSLGLDLSRYTNVYDLNMAIYKTYIEKFDLTSTQRRKALKKVLDNYVESGYISSDENISGVFDVDRLLSLSAFKIDFKKQCESYILDKFERAVKNEEEKKLRTSESFYQGYSDLFDAQEKAYTDSEGSTDGKNKYETALKDETFQVYHYGEEGEPNGCGYVLSIQANLNSTQLNYIEVNSKKAHTTDEMKQDLMINQLLNLKVKDQRAYWVNNVLGSYDKDNGFTFFDVYCKTENPLINKYNGTIEGAESISHLSQSGDEYFEYKFSTIEPKEITFTELYTTIVCPIMGFDTSLLTNDWSKLRDLKIISGNFETSTIANDIKISTGELLKLEDSSIEDEFNAIVLKDNIKDKFVDIMYAYSTDTTTLKEGYGTVYYSTIGTSSNKEFYEACGKLIESGVGSYMICQTSKGYEIMICSKVLKGFKTKYTKEQFDSLLDVKDSMPYEYLKKQYELNATTYLDSAVSNLLTKCGGEVQEYKKRYKDLLEG